MDDVALNLPPISDETMQQGRASLRAYTVAILRRGPGYHPPESDPIIWEHGRRNYALRAAGLLRIVCPTADATDFAGVGIFAADVATVESIMQADPAVQANVLTYELHPTRSFPGDSLA
jgi:hypothetical protein